MSAIRDYVHFSIENRGWLAKCFALQDFPDRKALRDLIETDGIYLAEIPDALIRERCASLRAVNLVLLDAAFKRDKTAFDEAVGVQEIVLDQILALSMLSPQDLKKIKRKPRPSSPEKIKRNVEICDLRKGDRKKWSMPQLARKYGMTRQTIEMILKNEAKWRKRLSEISSD